MNFKVSTIKLKEILWSFLWNNFWITINPYLHTKGTFQKFRQNKNSLRSKIAIFSTQIQLQMSNIKQKCHMIPSTLLKIIPAGKFLFRPNYKIFKNTIFWQFLTTFTKLTTNVPDVLTSWQNYVFHKVLFSNEMHYKYYYDCSKSVYLLFFPDAQNEAFVRFLKRL